jgi:hypothetical protein
VENVRIHRATTPSVTNSNEQAGQRTIAQLRAKGQEAWQTAPSKSMPQSGHS